MLIKKYALNKHVHLLTRLYGIRAESNKQEMASYLINFLSTYRPYFIPLVFH